MKFRLVFRGALPPKDKATVDAKDEIRRQLHPQLRTLWQQNPGLKNAFTTVGADGVTSLGRIANHFRRCGFGLCR